MKEQEAAKLELISMIVNVNHPSPSYWRQLISSRTAMIEPHLDVMTLSCLGDVRYPLFWTTGHGPYHSELKGCRRSDRSKFPPKTRGIFVADWSWFYSDQVTFGVEKIVTLWGFTRQKEWISAELKCHVVSGDGGMKDVETIVGHIEIEPVTVLPSTLDLLARSPQKAMFWGALGDTISEWHRRTADRCRITTDLNERVELEDLLMKARGF